jgi:O-antigen/teichoic acid export membrane protein
MSEHPSRPVEKLVRLARRLIGLVRLTPFDLTSELGRAEERHRRILLAALASAAARGVGIFTALFTVPLTVGFLGDERYGLWMAISSVIGMLGFADLGMGSGLLSAIADAYGRQDRRSAQQNVSSAFVMLTVVAAVILSVFAVVYWWIDWPRAFNVTTSLAGAEAGPTMVVLVACFALGLPLSVVNRVQLGYQEGFAANLWNAGGSLGALAAVVYAVQVKAGLPWLVFAIAGAPVAVMALNGLSVAKHRPWLVPRSRFVSRPAVTRLFSTGILFFMLQLAMALAFASDNFIIAQVLGAGAVTDYAIPARLFGTIGTLLPIVLAPLWPAYGESIARGDVAWIKRTLVRSLILTAAVSGIATLGLVLFAVPIVHLWVGPNVTPSPALLIPLGIWSVLNALGSAVAMLLNGLNKLRVQAILAIMMGVTGIVVKVALARVLGVSGVVWGTVLVYTVWIAVPFAIWVPRILSQMTGPTMVETARQRPA